MKFRRIVETIAEESCIVSENNQPNDEEREEVAEATEFQEILKRKKLTMDLVETQQSVKKNRVFQVLEPICSWGKNMRQKHPHNSILLTGRVKW